MIRLLGTRSFPEVVSGLLNPLSPLQRTWLRKIARPLRLGPRGYLGHDLLAPAPGGGDQVFDLFLQLRHRGRGLVRAGEQHALRRRLVVERPAALVLALLHGAERLQHRWPGHGAEAVHERHHAQRARLRDVLEVERLLADGHAADVLRRQALRLRGRLDRLDQRLDGGDRFVAGHQAPPPPPPPPLPTPVLVFGGRHWAMYLSQLCAVNGFQELKVRTSAPRPGLENGAPTPNSCGTTSARFT